jgi:pSer/pThr/pTyr-binding forkhead associated (FHA) protein
MRAKLTVLRGSNKGKSVLIAKPQYVMGRGESCNLRLNHESISRKHCAFAIHPNRITLRDLGSRNGTLLNGVRLADETEIKTGDKIEFGPLVFAVQIVDKHGKVIKAASAVTNAQAKTGDSGLISDWLSDAENDAPASDNTTRLFKLELSESNESSEAASNDATKSIKNADTKALKAALKKEKSKPKKLPPKMDLGEDTSEAAAETLRRLFNRGT